MSGWEFCWAILAVCAVVALIVGTYEWRDHQRRRAMARHPANARPAIAEGYDFTAWEAELGEPYDWSVSGL